jgi:RHS repeat-associated protein
MTDALGNVWSYSFDTLNRLVSETDPLHNVLSWSYDSASDVTASTNQDGWQTTFAHDTMGRLTGQTLPVNATTSAVYSFGFDAAGNETSAVVPLYYSGSTLVAATTTQSYDSMNRLSGTTDPVGDTVQEHYDAAGNLVGVTNGLGSTTTYSYNSASELVGTIVPLSGSATATTTLAYDAAGELSSLTNPLNQTTQYTYTSRGWLASQTDPLSTVTTYSYDAVGDRTGLTQNSGKSGALTYAWTYNNLHQLTGEMDPLGSTTTLAYNAAGLLTSVTGYNDGQGNVSYAYNAVGLLTSQSDALGDTYQLAYDAAGNQVQATDPLGNVTSYSFDRRNALVSVTNALNGVTSYSYNLAGWRTGETDPDGNTTQYGYNGAGELTSETNPQSAQETLAYDAAGDLTGLTNFDGQQASYSYNLAGLRTGETWLNSQGQSIYLATYSYNSAGQLSAASDPNSAYSYSYNADGALTQQVVTYPGLSSQALVTLTYAYDAFGDRTSLNDSLGGKVTYSYNANYQPTAITLSQGSTAYAQLSLSYDSQDRLSAISRSDPAAGMGGAIIKSTYGYDAANRLLGLTYTNTSTWTTLASFTYSYNAASEVTSYTGPEGTSTYTYDKLAELVGVTGAQAGTYSYDANGNRTMTGYHTGTGNELTSDGTYTYTYDNAGNLLSKADSAGNVWSYTWDTRGRLTQVVETNASHQTVLTEQLTYDVLNNLIAVSVNGVVQRWTVYDGTQPYLDFTSGGQVSERYLTDPRSGTLYARVSPGGTTSWYLTDYHGSVREIVGSSGSALDTISYDPSGNTLTETSPSNGDRFKYNGGQLDSNLAAYLFGARWYSTADGCWLSRDPLDMGPDTNPYRFVYNSPTNGTDPSGELAPLLLGLLAFGGGGFFFFGPGANVAQAPRSPHDYGVPSLRDDLQAGGAGALYGIGIGVPAWALACAGSGGIGYALSLTRDAIFGGAEAEAAADGGAAVGEGGAVAEGAAAEGGAVAGDGAVAQAGGAGPVAEGAGAAVGVPPIGGAAPLAPLQQEAAHVARDLLWHRDQLNMLNQFYAQIRDNNNVPAHIAELLQAHPEVRPDLLQQIADNIHHHQEMIRIFEQSLRNLGF